MLSSALFVYLVFKLHFHDNYFKNLPFPRIENLTEIIYLEYGFQILFSMDLNGKKHALVIKQTYGTKIRRHFANFHLIKQTYIRAK